MKLKKLFHLLVLAASMGFLFTPQSTVRGQSDIKKYITNLDCDAFPTMTLTVRAVDPQGVVIPRNLSTDDFTIYDNNTLVTDPNILTPETGPKYVIFSFNLGVDSNLHSYKNEIQSVMRDFAENYFKEDIDKVTIVAHTSSDSYDVRLEDTPSRDKLITAISKLDLAPVGNKTVGLEGLNQILSKINTTYAERTNTVIIHFGRYIVGDDKAVVLGKLMATKKIKIYVFQTEIQQDKPYLYTAYQKLAENSYGNYVPIPNNENFSSQYINILETIEKNSKVYPVRFSMQEYVQSHTIYLAEKGASRGSTTEQATCVTLIQNPKVVIDDPKDGGERLLEYGVSTVQVTAHVEWDDKHPRKIEKAQLFADGILKDTDGSFDSDATFYLDLPILDLIGSQPEIHVTLRVYVEDQGGLKDDESIKYTYKSSQTLTPPTEKPPGPGTPTLTPTQGPIVTTEPLCSDGITINCVTSWARLNWLLLTFVGIVVVLFILLLSTRRQLALISAPAREALGKRVVQVRDQVRKTLLGGASHRQEAIAFLHVLNARSDRVGAKIEIYNNRTTLGRDPSVTDVQLFNPDDKTSVSGLHCTIFYDPGKGKFLITDDNSTNGTYVNGKRLEPNEPADLNDEDEIILGDIYRQGAKLRFEVAARHPEFPAEAEPPPVEEDFNIDLEPYTPYPAESSPEQPPVVKEKPKKEFDETVPGYREEEDFTSQDKDPDQPPSSTPGSQQKRGKDKSWLDKLG